MKNYGSNAPGTDSQTNGPGGSTAALARNPNELSDLNGMPEGPLSHQLGFTGDGAMTSDALVKGFHFK